MGLLLWFTILLNKYKCNGNIVNIVIISGSRKFQWPFESNNSKNIMNLHFNNWKVSSGIKSSRRSVGLVMNLFLMNE